MSILWFKLNNKLKVVSPIGQNANCLRYSLRYQDLKPTPQFSFGQLAHLIQIPSKFPPHSQFLYEAAQPLSLPLQERGVHGEWKNIPQQAAEGSIDSIR
ncbi:hypothetical protein RRG08_002919 [Elysia crispata]|uniref:Uncharacterized protein n=1 Tax=Elysia crispata TaxID=231223 RepID=A0AAE1E3J1_9GAST|nr:hypothetical protein RRG08_002919 [Elysia crispata]